MPPSLRKSYSWFLIGAGLVNTLCLTLVLMSLGFIAGFSLTAWHFPLAIALALVTNYFAAGYFFKEGGRPVFIRTSAWIIAIIVFSLGFAQLFYDISNDGQMYHIESAYQFKNGWNPFHHLLPFGFREGIWLNHYGKGTEAPQGAVYALTNHIDSAKGTNIMLLIGSFAVCMSFFTRTEKFTAAKSVFLSILFSFCPVTMYQLVSTYVDGQVGSLLLCFIMIGALFFYEMNRYFLILLSSVLIVLINIKFTSVVFAGIFAVGLFAALYFGKQAERLKKVFITSALAGIFAFAVVGYFPYIRNIVEFHDPLYPGMAKLKSEAARNSPDSFAGMSGPRRLFTSLFTHTSDLHLYVDKNPVVPLKIPFTFNKLDIFNACKPYVVIMAGMGPFFSGLLLLSFIFYLALARRLLDRRLFITGTIALLTVWASVFIISEAWWMRYIPQIWFIPLIIVVMTELLNIAWVRKVRTICYVIFFINLSFSLVTLPFTLYATAKINYQLDQLKATHETVQIDFDYFAADRIRFFERNIPLTIVESHDEGTRWLLFSPAKVTSPRKVPDLPKPWLLRLGDRIKDKIRH